MGGTNVVVKIKLHEAAPVGGQVVNLSSTTQVPDLPATITFPEGATTKAISITPSSVDTDTAAFLEANAPGFFVSAPFTVQSAVLTIFSIAPGSVVGGIAASGVLTLNGAAGASGVEVTMATGSPKVQIPIGVTVPYNSKVKAFPILTGGVAATTVTSSSADWGGFHFTAGLTLTRASLLTLTTNVPSAVGGTNFVLTARLNGAAPAGGFAAALSGNANANLPATVTVPAGKIAGSVSFNPKGVDSSVAYTLSGTLDAVTKTAPLTVNPASLVSIGFSPPAIVGGTVTSGVIKLNGLAGPSGAVITSPFIHYSPTVTVADQTKTFAFAVPTLGVNVTTFPKLYATYGAGNLNATLTLYEAIALSATCLPLDTTPNKTVQVTLRLNGNAANLGRSFNVTYSGTSNPSGSATCLVLPGQKAVAINVRSGTSAEATQTQVAVTFTGPDGDTVTGFFTVSG